MLYGTLVVEQAYPHKCGENRYVYVCDLKSFEVGDLFVSMIMENTACQENIHYSELSRYFVPGNLLHCEFAYKMTHEFLQLCITRFKLCTPVNMDTGYRISAADYMNPSRGYNVYEMIGDEWIEVRNGFLNLSGNAYLLLNGDQTHYSYDAIRAKKEQAEKKNNSLLTKMYNKIYNFLSGK